MYGYFVPHQGNQLERNSEKDILDEIWELGEETWALDCRNSCDFQ